ncbi:MAG: hypothetical protein BGO98_47930 [Myxococcales bacterium 68-20]|nr:MAG: hypothetical protein BGO98_47930 [Myxococcales bacterium 68-20]
MGLQARVGNERAAARALWRFCPCVNHRLERARPRSHALSSDGADGSTFASNDTETMRSMAAQSERTPATPIVHRGDARAQLEERG